jgi:hypothetical protein
MAPLILNLGTRWRWVVNCTPGRFTPGKERRYPLNKSLGGPQIRYGCFWRGISLSSTWIRSPNHSACRTVPIPGLANLWHAERFRWHAAFTAVPLWLFFLYPTSVSILWRTYAQIHISDCVQTAYELPLLPNNNASETFLHKSRAVKSIEWGLDLAVSGRTRDTGKKF